MTLIINGQNETHPEGSTIRTLLDGKKLSPDKVAVELNRRLVRSSGGGYDRALADGDIIEIVTFVGGG